MYIEKISFFMYQYKQVIICISTIHISFVMYKGKLPTYGKVDKTKK